MTRYCCVGKSVNLLDKTVNFLKVITFNFLVLVGETKLLYLEYVTVNKGDFLKVINLYIQIFIKDSIVGKTKPLGIHI